MKEINLEKILNKYSIYLSPYVKEHLQLKAAINDIICKILDLAVENAVGKVDLIYGENLEYPSCEEVAVIDKNSILQIKDWIK